MTLEVKGATMRSAAQRIQSALAQKYDTYTQDINGAMRVRVENSSKAVTVRDSPGGVEIDMDLGLPEDRSLVRNEFEGTSQSNTTQNNQIREQETDRGERVATTTSMGQVHKPFSQEEAGYVSPQEARTSDKKCKNCAHYDNHGNCHIVPDIEPNGHCEEFYADAGFYAVGSKLQQEVSEVNLVLWGEMSTRRLEGSSPAKVLSDIEEEFREKFDERDIQM